MRFVEFSAFTGVGVVEIFGKIVWHKGKLFAEGKQKEMLERLLDEPIRDLRKKDYPILTKEDGLQFLEALPYFYSGYKLCCSQVREGKNLKGGRSV